MSVESKALGSYNTASDIHSSCDSPEAPAVAPSLPHSDPITIASLAELLKDVVKTVQATAKSSRAASAEYEAGGFIRAPRFKTVDEMYVHSNHMHKLTS